MDFHTPFVTVDVKTSRSRVLYREADKTHPEVLVLAGYDDETDAATLLGWAWDADVVRRSPQRNQATGVVNHVMRPAQLRSLDSLRLLLFTGRR